MGKPINNQTCGLQAISTVIMAHAETVAVYAVYAPNYDFWCAINIDEYEK